MEHVILVDEHDNEVGTMEKMEAHRKGLLHRAFSILIFNSKGEMLLQQRANEKYHSGGLWTNACCSHPRPGESIAEAGKRKLKQEMGIECDLTYSFKFIYKVALENELSENEWDYVLIGQFDGKPHPNPNEASDWKFVNLEDINQDVRKNPNRYTYWFKMILNHPEFNKTVLNPAF